ncbi:hypothetical protein C4571_03295 [Candidatus Parcubacteria bacterium]|nr:MAG: hypothetical protein C4571_03295 [Candidatus Parcubacteria bacterium]
MNNSKKIEWILRIAVAGEYVGHGVFALGGKAQWIGWIERLTGVGNELAGQLLFLVGLMDLAVALVVLIRPISWVLLWAAFWGFWTALVRPIVGEPVWDFIERWANWGAPLALYYVMRSAEREEKRL